MKLIITLITLCTVLSIQAQQTPEQRKAAADEELNNAAYELRIAINKEDEKAIKNARLKLHIAERNYQSAERARVANLLAKLEERNRGRYTARQIAEMAERQNKIESAVLNHVEDQDKISDQKNRNAYQSNNDAQLRKMLIEESVNNEYHRKYTPFTERFAESSGTKYDPVVDTKVERMSYLLKQIQDNNYNDSNQPSEAGKNMDKILKRTKYDRHLAEYERLANARDWRDPDTNKLYPPALQDRARDGNLTILEQQVRANAHDGGLPESFTNIFTEDKKDSRLRTAQNLMAERENDLSRTKLQHLDGLDPTPQENFRAMAVAIDKKKAGLEKWYSEEFLPKANGGDEHVVKQWFKLGMGTALRSINKDGDEGVDTIRRKLNAVIANGDEATAALAFAAKNDPSVFEHLERLPPKERLIRQRQKELLMNYEMLEEDGSGKLVYRIPSETRKLNSVTNMDFPKSPWLDAVSVKTGVITAGSMATGSSAAALASKLGKTANLSRTGAAALSTLTEIGASSSMDAVITKMEGKEVKIDEILLQNLTMAGVGKLTKGLGDEMMKRPSWKAALKNEGGDGVVKSMRNFLAGKNGYLNSPEMRRFVTTTAGLTSDASIEVAYQAALQDSPISMDAFMANLASGAVSKVATNALKRGVSKGTDIGKYVLDKLPPGVRDWAIARPKEFLQTIERARKSEAHVKGVMDRFEAVKRSADDSQGLGLLKRRRLDAELIYDPKFADHVADSLAKGEMKWSDLGIIAEEKGSKVQPLLEAVKARRTKWAYGVDDPSASVVNKRAKTILDSQLEAKIAEVEASGKSKAEKGQEIRKLKTRHKMAMSELDSPTGQGPASKLATSAKSKAFSDEFNDRVMNDGVGKEVKAMAERELAREFQSKRDALARNEENLSTGQRETRRKALDEDEMEQLQKIREAKMIAPGSTDPTSDIDRSWNNARVVQSMKRLQRQKLMLEQNGVRGIGKTTARTWDLNEYFNVMDGVSSAMPHRNHAENGFADLKVDVEGIGTLTHDQIVAGNSRASAMSHMDAEHKAQYKKEILKSAGDDTKKKAALELEFKVAEKELAESKLRLDRARKHVAKELGLDPNSKEADIYARDKVYGEQMRDLNTLDQQIAKEKVGSKNWKKLQSERERVMNRASRDGIEAYTDGAGLDIIVNRMQQARHPDGSKKSVSDLWKDPQFNLKGKLKDFSKSQINNAINDNVKMIAEHLDASNQGSESMHQTARALAKYGQRTALFDKIKGENMPDGHPMKELYNATSKLIKYKGDPEGMKQALKELAGPNGTARDGLRKLKQMTEAAVPGLNGYSAVKPKGEKNLSAPKGFSSLRSYKDWLRDRDEIYERDGDYGVQSWIKNQGAALKNHRQSLIAEKRKLQELNSKYLPEDMAKGRKLEEDLYIYKSLLQMYAKIKPRSPRYNAILSKVMQTESAINALKKKREDYLKDHDSAPVHKDIEAIDRELAFIKERGEMLLEAFTNGTRPPRRTKKDLVDALLEGEIDKEGETKHDPSINTTLEEEVKKMLEKQNQRNAEEDQTENKKDGE